MIEELTIKEANDRIKKLENTLELLLNRKELLFTETQPKAVDTTKEKTTGGKREDIILQYLIECDEEELDKAIENVQHEIFNLSKYVEAELKRIGEYEPLKAKIIELRQTTTLGWDKIAEATNYSERQCRRIYKNYIEKRYFE